MSRLPAAQRREQLLDRAATLFAEKGYARATTAQLARSAGVTEPIIYRHFKSKRELFIALIERAGAMTLAMWKRHLRGASDPAERLRRLIGDNPMVMPEGRDAYRVVLQAITEVDDKEIHDAVEAHMNALHQFLVGEVERAQAEHKVTSRFPAEIIAWLLVDVALGYGILSAMRIQGQGRSPDGTHVRDVIARMLVGPGSKNHDARREPRGEDDQEG